MHEFSYSLSRGETRITIGKSVKDSIRELPEDSLIVYPEGVSSLVEPYISGTSFQTYIVKDGEEGKSLPSVLGIIDAMRDAGFRRSSTLVSVGGGSTSDATGMAASMYMRGIGFISIPTTLLAMVDASLGGKNAVNFSGVKNLLGSFFSPSNIYIDTSLVQSMPPELITDGLGEISKYAMIQDADLYKMLSRMAVKEILGDKESLETLISRCVSDKMKVVSLDEFDQLGERVILNFGHTLGHALESASSFSVGHGTAVAHGMLLELELGEKLGLIDHELTVHAQTLLEKLDLPHRIDRIYVSALSSAMSKVISSDKKAARNTVKMPLPVDIGKSSVFNVRLQEVEDYLREFRQ